MNRNKPQPARDVAFQVMRDVAERDAYANLALASRIRDARLNGRDAAFATELVAGALRQRATYDRVIELASGRRVSAIDPPVLDVLRIAVHQLLGMRTATHAAVFESVELGRRHIGRRTSGFINGVLRTITRSSPETWTERILEGVSNEDARLALKTSHPDWIVRQFRLALGHESREHELEELLLANNTPPRVQLALLTGDLDAATGESMGIVPRGISPLGWELERGKPDRVLGQLKDRRVTARVQDQGSQLAALALTGATPIRRGERWLDLCAGPGGKTALLASRSREVTVRANEVSAHRAELVQRSVEGFSVEVVTHDGRRQEAFGGNLFDRILVDAPCTGLGALRRRPEARWRKHPDDVPALVALQRELLEAASNHLAPGGILAYVTCSPHLAETRDVVRAHAELRPDLRQLDARAILNKVARTELDLPDRGDLTAQLWPHRHGSDAMFVALFTRESPVE